MRLSRGPSYTGHGSFLIKGLPRVHNRLTPPAIGGSDSRGDMDTRNRTRVAPLLLALAAATLVIIRPSAQGARPPDIAGEWRLDNAEDPGQPPLADYLGIAVQRGRPAARRHDAGIDLGHARIPVPAALGAASVARRRRRAHPEGAGSAVARDAAYHLQFMRSLDRPIFMDGRPHPPA